VQPVDELEEKIKQTIAYLRVNGISIPSELLPVDDINPQEITAQQIRMDKFGSANVVKYKLGNHIKDADNPHIVTAEQVGADKLGSADIVQLQLSSHVQDTSNPHNITAKQIGAEELGGVDDALTQLGQHILDLENPHRVTATQLGVDNIGPQLDGHIQDNDNPHVVTSEQVGSPRLVIDAEVEHLVAFLNSAGEQKDSGKGIWDFAPAEHTHPTPIPMMMSGGVKQMTLTAGDLTATAPLLFNVTRQVVGGPADVSIPMATALVDGYLSTIDWMIFNNKQNALVFPLAANLGGTGVANAGTLTNANNTIITGGGTLTLGGFTLTVPATGAATLLGVANVFTANQTITKNSESFFTAETTLAGSGAQVRVKSTIGQWAFYTGYGDTSFYIYDVTNTKFPFKVEAGGIDNAFVIKTSGYVGLNIVEGPVTQLHARGTLTLDQSFAAYATGFYISIVPQFEEEGMKFMYGAVKLWHTMGWNAPDTLFVDVGLDVAGSVVINNGGLATSDFRVESDIYDALFVDAGNDSVMVMSNVAGKVGFYGIPAIVQPAGAAQVAPAAYVTGAFGLDSDAHMQALFDLVVAMRLALVNLGIIKGAA